MDMVSLSQDARDFILLFKDLIKFLGNENNFQDY